MKTKPACALFIRSFIRHPFGMPEMCYEDTRSLLILMNGIHFQSYHPCRGLVQITENIHSDLVLGNSCREVNVKSAMKDFLTMPCVLNGFE